ncbi:hypothetical protein BKA57DRAFT_410766, partial [Linnemannia elongata]
PFSSLPSFTLTHHPFLPSIPFSSSSPLILPFYHSSVSPLLLLGHHSPSLVNSFSHVFAPLFPPLRNNKHPSQFTFFTRLCPSIFHFFTPPLNKYITSIFLLPSSFFTRVLIVPFFFHQPVNCTDNNTNNLIRC